MFVSIICNKSKKYAQILMMSFYDLYLFYCTGMQCISAKSLTHADLKKRWNASFCIQTAMLHYAEGERWQLSFSSCRISQKAMSGDSAFPFALPYRCQQIHCVSCKSRDIFDCNHVEASARRVVNHTQKLFPFLELLPGDSFICRDSNQLMSESLCIFFEEFFGF